MKHIYNMEQFNGKEKKDSLIENFPDSQAFSWFFLIRKNSSVHSVANLQ